MAVGADNLALCDLVEDALPAPVRERPGDVEGLVSEVVELEDDRVGLAAVGAGVGAEVLDEIRRALERKLLLPAAGLLHGAQFIRQVVLAFVGRSTLAAHVVALTATLPPPIELAERLDLAAATASSPAIGRRNPHTNTCSLSIRMEMFCQALRAAGDWRRDGGSAMCRCRSRRWPGSSRRLVWEAAAPAPALVVQAGQRGSAPSLHADAD